MHACMNICMHACMPARTHVCMHACMQGHVHACMHVCMYACVITYSLYSVFDYCFVNQMLLYLLDYVHSQAADGPTLASAHAFILMS